ncbi:calcium homeostasis modulator protein 6-like [Chroicocephalus ridibundus]|uniref:calcium homeostasis modulator protein 6-like n=1 Tax=Chroicocephalus ridibundus TaxID=1192867 RepID=UPI002FDE3B72
MFVRKQFLSFWKSHYNIVAVSFYSMILIVLEEIMEIEFKCPQRFSLKLGYVLSYFLCPAFIILVLSVTSNPACITCTCCIGKCSWCRTAEIIFRILLPPLIWCVILLCDGRYIDCVASGNERNSKQNANQSTAAEFLSESYTISQIAGLAVLAVVSLLYGLYRVCHFWLCRNNKEHWKEDLGSLLEKEVRKHIKEMKKEGAKDLMEKKVKPSLQQISTDFWKNIDYRNTAKKIKEVVESVITDTRERQQAVKQGEHLLEETTTEPTSETTN